MNGFLNEDALVNLGFVEVNVSIEECGGDPFKYYTLDLGGGLEMISCADNERIGEYYHVYFFDFPETGKYNDYIMLDSMIKLIKSGIK